MASYNSSSWILLGFIPVCINACLSPRPPPFLRNTLLLPQCKRKVIWGRGWKQGMTGLMHSYTAITPLELSISTHTSPRSLPEAPIILHHSHPLLTLYHCPQTPSLWYDIVLPHILVMAARSTWISHLSKSRTVCCSVFTPTASMNPMGAQSSTTVWMLRGK